MRPVAPLRLVRSLSEPERVFKHAVETGFRHQHQARGHRDQSITFELERLHQFEAFSGRPFWECTPLDMDRYGASLHERRAPLTTIRAKQGAVRRFLHYAHDPAYPWDEKCLELTGSRVPLICTPENTLRHQYGAETTKRRNLTSSELEALFAHVRARIDDAHTEPDQLARFTHYALFSFALGTGARAQEIAYGDLPDLIPSTTPEIAAYSPYEAFVVRYGKACPGGAQRQRSIVATPVFRDAFRILEWYLKNVRPRLERPTSPPAIFLSRKGGRLRPASLSGLFKSYRSSLRLSTDLTFHCLRHSFATILREHDYRLAVLKELLGHRCEASTLIYDHRGAEYAHAQIVALARRTNRKLLAWQATTGV